MQNEQEYSERQKLEVVRDFLGTCENKGFVEIMQMFVVDKFHANETSKIYALFRGLLLNGSFWGDECATSDDRSKFQTCFTEFGRFAIKCGFRTFQDMVSMFVRKDEQGLLALKF